MAVQDVFGVIQPHELRSEKSMGYDASVDLVLGINQDVHGVSFPKDYDSRTGGQRSIASYTGMVYMTDGATLAANVSFKILFQGDGQTEAADLGTKVVFGVTTKVLASTAHNMDFDATADPYLGVEQTATAALGTASSTAGNPYGTQGVGICTIAVATGTGTMGSGAATGLPLAFRIRRIGTATADTCTGRIIVPLVVALNA